MVQRKQNPNPSRDYFIKPSDIQAAIGISKNTALRLEDTGQFPRRRRISPGRTGWLASEVFAWVASRESVKD